MTKTELLEKIAKRLFNSLDCLNGDSNWCRCQEEIEDEIEDIQDILYNFKEDDKLCYKCLYFDEFGKTPFKSFCKFHRFDVRYLYSCPRFLEAE